LSTFDALIGGFWEGVAPFGPVEGCGRRRIALRRATCEGAPGRIKYWGYRLPADGSSGSGIEVRGAEIKGRAALARRCLRRLLSKILF